MISLYEKAGKLKSENAYLLLAQLYMSGKLGYVDEIKCEECLNEAAELDLYKI